MGCNCGQSEGVGFGVDRECWREVGCKRGALSELVGGCGAEVVVSGCDQKSGSLVAVAGGGRVHVAAQGTV